MRKIVIAFIALSASGCNTMTGDQYCGGELGLQKGTNSYANCRMYYTQRDDARKKRMGDILGSFGQNSPQMQIPPQPQQINVRHSYY